MTTALEIDRGLMARLDALGVRIDVADDNTIALRNVPANSARFTKARTNLLMQRPRAGLPFIVGVDEDLEYVGADQAVARMFAAAQRQRGWRVLRVDLRATEPFQDVVERALKIVGFDGGEPAVATPSARSLHQARSGLLATAVSLTDRVRAGTAQPTIGREEAVETVVSSILQRHARLPVIAGNAGVGKTNLLHAVARRIETARPSFDVIRMDLSSLLAGTLFDADRENVLATLLTGAAHPDVVLCVERVDLIRRAAPQGPLLLNAAIEDGVKIVGTAPCNTTDWLRSLPFSGRLQFIELDEPDGPTVIDIVMRLGETLAAHHHVSIDEAVVRAAVDRAQALEGFFPAKAIALVDAAATRASLAGSPTLELVHVYVAATCIEGAGD